MNYFEIIRSIMKDKFKLSHLQANLTILSMITLLFQGIGFYFVDSDRMNKNAFLLLIIIGIVYNVFYFKTYVN
jgi:hypothetical protein